MHDMLGESSEAHESCALYQRGEELDAADLIPYLAGRFGQASLARFAGYAHPELDQHLATVTDAAAAELGSQRDDPARLLAFLVNYASGFVAAAAGHGWRPVPDHHPLDWESIRLAAVCQLVRQVTEAPAPGQSSDRG
jgi:hypothetical protein